MAPLSLLKTSTEGSCKNRPFLLLCPPVSQIVQCFHYSRVKHVQQRFGCGQLPGNSSLPSLLLGSRLSRLAHEALVIAAAGHVPIVAESTVDTWPEFRKYATEKYGSELDDDLITTIESLIEHRRDRRYGHK